MTPTKHDRGRESWSQDSSHGECQTSSLLACRPGNMICTGGGAVHHKRYYSSEDVVQLHLFFPEFATKVRDLALKPPGDHPYDMLKMQLIKWTAVLARSPLISEGVQSCPPVLSQLQLPAQATITPSSVQAPFQQAITKEQMNFSLSASNQGLFTNGCFMNCTFQINVGQNPQKRTKRPRVIYSDSDED